MKKVTIAQAKERFEQIINEKVAKFMDLGRQAQLLQEKNTKPIDAIHQKMAEIVKEFEPVEEIVLSQNPQWRDLFEGLKKLLPQEEVVAEVVSEENPTAE